MEQTNTYPKIPQGPKISPECKHLLILKIYLLGFILYIVTFMEDLIARHNKYYFQIHTIYV